MARALAVAAPLGLSNFAGGVAIGLDGLGLRARVRVAVTFALFEAGAPLLGLALGRRVAGSLAGAAPLLGGLALVALGVWPLVVLVFRTAPDRPQRRTSFGRRHLLVTAAALSIDNLVVGFALGAVRVPVIAAAVIIGAVSAVLGLVGLELGHRLGRRIDRGAEALSAAGLALVGALVALRAL